MVIIKTRSFKPKYYRNVNISIRRPWKKKKKKKKVHGTREVEKGKSKEDEGGLLSTPRKAWEIIHSIHVGRRRSAQ